MSGQIFISYQREDSWGVAGRLSDRLREQFGRNQIFMDLDSIELGGNFMEVIETTVAKCDVLLAVIGNNWLITKDECGDRRLDNPADWVRKEIGTALHRQIRVIPILVGSALMPRSTDLPDDLKPIVSLNALRLTSDSFEGDVQRLAGAIGQVLEKVAAKEQKRLATEQGQREEGEARQCQERERERLEAEKREEERLEAERREKERLEAEQSERKEKERLEALQRERLQAKQREKDRLDAERRERAEKQRQESERLASDRREKDQLEAERQRHLKATGSGSEPQLEAKAKRSAVPPGGCVATL
jgi:flagellar biosynthesis GTPase FlhF